MITHWQQEPPEVPFYAVIFISQKSEDLEAYAETDDLMMKMASEREGFLGYSSMGDGKKGIFISYWRDEAAIDAWRNNQEHRKAKTAGAKQWYRYYHSMICKVESSRIHGEWLAGFS